MSRFCQRSRGWISPTNPSFARNRALAKATANTDGSLTVTDLAGTAGAGAGLPASIHEIANGENDVTSAQMTSLRVSSDTVRSTHVPPSW